MSSNDLPISEDKRRDLHSIVSRSFEFNGNPQIFLSCQAVHYYDYTMRRVRKLLNEGLNIFSVVTVVSNTDNTVYVFLPSSPQEHYALVMQLVKDYNGDNYILNMWAYVLEVSYNTKAKTCEVESIETTFLNLLKAAHHVMDAAKARQPTM